MKQDDHDAHDEALDALLADWRDEGHRAAARALPEATERVLARAPSPAAVVVPLPRRQRIVAAALLVAAATSGIFVGSSTGGDDEADGDMASYDYGATLVWAEGQ